MEKLGIRFFIGLLFSSLLLPLPTWAINYFQYFPNARVDWSNGIVEAKGVGSPPASSVNAAQARALAKNAAINTARRNLFDIVKNIPINSLITIGDFLDKNQIVYSELIAFLRGSKVVDIRYLPDESVEVMLSTQLNGFLADLVLPKTIRIINPIQQPRRDGEGENSHFTGLIVDCRGFHVRPSMSPRILDENGKEVYGSVTVSRDYAIGHGMVGYTKELEDAKVDLRVANRPLAVKGIRTSKNGLSDIIVSTADAAKIRGTASNLNFLQKCKVIIVLD